MAVARSSRHGDTLCTTGFGVMARDVCISASKDRTLQAKQLRVQPNFTQRERHASRPIYRELRMEAESAIYDCIVFHVSTLTLQDALTAIREITTGYGANCHTRS